MRSRWCGLILSAIMARSSRRRSAIAVRVFEDQARHQMRSVSGASPPEGAPFRRPLVARACRREQIELPRFAAWIAMDARQPSHGSLPDSGRESPLLRPKAGHSMMRHRRVRLSQQRDQRAQCSEVDPRGRNDSLARTTPGRTSRPGVPASGPRLVSAAAKHRRPPSRSPHEHEPRTRPTDESDKEPRVPRSCGRSGVDLYNTIRPHASIGYKPPAPEVFVPAFAAWPAALRRPAPPATLAQRPTLN